MIYQKIKIIFLCATTVLPILCFALDIAKVEGSKWYKNYKPHNSIDGKMTTAYVGIGNRVEISYYFKKPEKIESIKLCFSNACYHRPKKFSVMLKLLNGNWQKIKQFTKIANATEVIKLETPVNAIGMRLVVTKMSQSKDVTLREVIFNEKSDIVLKAWGGVKIAQVKGTKWYKDYTPEKSIDGKLKTAYAGIGSKSQIIYYFKKIEKISLITVLFSKKSYHRPQKCSISIQLQDASWKTVKKIDNIPEPLEAIKLQTPIMAKALKIQAVKMSKSKDFCINEVILNQKIYTSTRNSDIPRPALYHKKELNVQPFFPLKKFFHHGQGILFYSTPNIPKGRVEAILVVTPLSANKAWFINKAGIGIHHNIELLPVDRKLMKYSLQGPSGIHKFALHNNEDKVVLDQFYKPVDSKYSQNVVANGLVLRFPYYIWKNAKWQLGKHKGYFVPSNRPSGVNSVKSEAKFIDIKDTGVPFKMIFTLPYCKIEVTAKNFNPAKAVILNKSGIFGFFTDVCLVPSKGVCIPPGKQQAFKCEWDIKFSGNFVRPWRQAYELSDADIERLSDIDPTPLKLKKLIKACAGKKIDISHQIMNQSNPFYGANFKLGKESINQEIPLSTRSLALELAAQAAATKAPETFKRAAAALDYLSSTISSCRQYGDIRMGVWSLKPFMWDATAYAQAIECMRLAGANKEKLIYWRSGVHLLYAGGLDEMSEKIKFKTDIGANIATYAMQLAVLSKYFKDNAGMVAATKAMEYAITPNVGDDGIKKDYSYRHGNLFDISYYRWLNKVAGTWSDTYKGTKLDFKGESLNNYNQINNVIIWMFDNGLLNTMTAHGKNRLSFNKPGFPAYFKDWFRKPVAHLNAVRRTKDIAKIEKFVDDAAEFPLGFHYFDVAGMLVERSKQIYMSVWWNSQVTVRDNLHSGVNPNYNVKTPFGAYYMRVRNMCREVTIPSDNYHYSGAILADGMEEMKDWAHHFDNNKGSKVYKPVFFDGGAVLCAEVSLRARKAPNKIAKYFMTMIVTKDGLVRCITAPAQSSAPKVSEHPMVLRQYLSTPVDVKNIKVANEYKTFTLCWEKLAGKINYKWKLSDNNIDGSQRYSFIAPAKVRILNGSLDLSQPLTTAWELRPLNAPKITSKLELSLKKHKIILTDKTVITVDYNVKEVGVSGKITKLTPILQFKIKALLKR